MEAGEFSQLAWSSLRRPGANAYPRAPQAIDADLIDETFNRPRRGNENEIRMGAEVDEEGEAVAARIGASEMGWFKRRPDAVAAGAWPTTRNPRRWRPIRGPPTLALMAVRSPL